MEIIREVEDFNVYPSEAQYFLGVREKVNELIKLNIHSQAGKLRFRCSYTRKKGSTYR